MQRLQSGPFGGAFDELMYDSPAFVPMIVTCALLVFVWVAVVWALLRGRRQPANPRGGPGFPATLVDGRGPDD